MVTKDLGMVTAYAYAVAGGYTGTEAEFTQLMADLAVVVDDFDNFSVNVTTLPAGSSATASYADGVLSLGIPKGDKGDKGNTGDTGAPAGFGTVSATVDANIGTPSVEVTASGSDTAKNFAFAFHNLKGQKGDKGDTGEVSEAELAEALEDFAENGTVANAEQLTTKIRANDQTPYIFRTSGGSVDIGDREYINGIVGGTVVWNQWARNGNFADNSYWGAYDAQYSSISIANGKLTQTFTNLITPSPFQFGVSEAIPTSASKGDHRYFATINVKPSFSTTFRIEMGGSGTYYSPTVSANTKTTISTIGKFFGYNQRFLVYPASGAYNTDISGETVEYSNAMMIDLTQMFGSTIADYIYSLETANAGAGVAWFKKLFPKPHYAHNTGELKSISGLVSHDMTGFNQWDGEYEQGIVDVSNGQPVANTSNYRTKNYVPVLPSTTYCYSNESASTGIRLCYYDADKNFITSRSNGSTNPQTFATPSDCHYVRFYWADISKACLNISWDGSRDGEYEPYELHSYALDDSVTLRGIPKLDADNKLYYDGDTYESDGTVTRKYGIVDLGTLNWTYATSGVGTKVFYTDVLSDLKKVDNYNVANIMPSKPYPVKSWGALNLGADAPNAICVFYDGSVRIVDSAYSDAATFKTAMSGVYLVYELATPTTETADPYTNPQIVNDFGTEEWVLDSDVFPMPVGHNTDYPIDLKAQVEMMPHSPDGDGDYIVRQTNGTNEYVAFANNATIQNILARLEALEG